MMTTLPMHNQPPVCCEHDDVNPYETTGGGLDPYVTIAGRCVGCDSWLRQEIDLTTGHVTFTALDSAEIARLRRSVWL